jgi:hypothetical protein
MGKIRRGNYVFVFWTGDHEPRHVHVVSGSETRSQMGPYESEAYAREADATDSEVSE